MRLIELSQFALSHKQRITDCLQSLLLTTGACFCIRCAQHYAQRCYGSPLALKVSRQIRDLRSEIEPAL